MTRWRSRYPLQRRVTLVVLALIVLLLLRSAGLALTGWITRDDTAAVAALGSLQSGLYQFALRLAAEPGLDTNAELARLQRHLDSDSLREAVAKPGRSELAMRYQLLHRHWSAALHPLLARRDLAEIRREADLFADRAQRLSAELKAEHRRLDNWDAYLQLISVLLAGACLLWLLVALRRHIVTPLKQLLDATEQLRAGQLAVRVDYQSTDEFGQLAQGFNAMAADIEASHRSLQERMDDELYNLARANAALSLFCSSSRTIAATETNATEIDQLLSRFQALLPGLQLTLCLKPTCTVGGNVISFKGNGERQVCSHFDCPSCQLFSAGNQRIFLVRSQGQVLGELRGRFSGGQPPGEWEVMLTQALADLIGNALQVGSQREKDNFLLLHNERNTIARELRDSLAQALSFLKLQVARLQLLAERGDDREQLKAVSEELGIGLNDAYRQLRELLTTFRLNLSDGDLMNALKVAVEEFSRRGGLRILLSADALTAPLAASEEIHLLQILREALSNCCRHAAAEQAWVTLRQVGDDLELVVEDDGRGIAPSGGGQDHHGMAIMQERARSMDATLEVGPREPCGSRVRLRFRPRFLVRPSKELVG